MDLINIVFSQVSNVFSLIISINSYNSLIINVFFESIFFIKEKMLLNNKRKVSHKDFMRQILYLSSKRHLNSKQIRKILKCSYSKGVIPSNNVRKKRLAFF